MAKKLTTEEFITKARAIHGDKYDYSKVEYKNSKTKVCIVCPIHGEFWQEPRMHLSGKGCEKCGRVRQRTKTSLTQEEVIARFVEVHGDRFDYSKAKYVNSETSVCIICPIHGEFWQLPNVHISGCGCPKCGGKQRLTLEEFIERASVVHNGKFDYSKVEYINSATPVCIICPIHGEFWQLPSSHLRGKGCELCRHDNVRKIHLKKQEDVIEQFIMIHGDRYDYSKVHYKDGRVKVCIICPTHGEFWQTPNNHLKGQGCPDCAKESNASNRRYDTNDFITKAKNVHGNRFGYELVDYKDSLTPVEIICPKHGSFFQKPVSHLQGQGCPKCMESRGEKLVAQWLDSHNIEYIPQYTIIPQQVLFGTKKFRVDFYLSRLNTIIEYNGSQHYIRAECWHTEEDFTNQQVRDQRLREHCKQHGITLIEIPYTEIDNIGRILTKKLS